MSAFARAFATAAWAALHAYEATISIALANHKGIDLTEAGAVDRFVDHMMDITSRACEAGHALAVAAEAEAKVLSDD